MNLFKKILLIGLMFILGGIVLQSIGYIDEPFFAWFTDIQFFEV